MNEIILAFLKEHRPEFAVELEAFLRENIERISARLGGDTPSQSTLHAAIDWLDEKNQLVLAAEYDSAWNQHVLYHEGQSGFAFRKEFLNKMREAAKRKAYEFEYNELLKELGKEHLRGTPVERLREMVSVKRENDRRRSLSRTELNQLAKQETPAPQRGVLPPTWYGNNISTPEALKALWQRNFPAYQALVGRYGAETVNKFAGFKPTPKVGIAVNLEQLSTGASTAVLPPEVTREKLFALPSEEVRKLIRKYGAQAVNDRIYSRS